MARLRERAALRLLFREFLGQLFISESSVSDHQVKVAMIGVIVFLIMPGFFIPVRLIDTFELAATRFPMLISPLTRMMATVFVTFAMVAVGLVAVFEWDALTFERRDGQILGPLPIAGRTIVAAKLAALGALLLVAGFCVNLLTAVPFSFVATSHQSMAATVRLFVAHMVSTMTASAFVFCALITIRAATNLFTRGRVVIATLFQFALVTALLCFIIFTPTSMQLQFQRVPHRPPRVAGVHVQPVPSWSPTNWFVGLYDVIRGAAQPGAHRQALIAVLATVASAAAAAITVLIGYRRQLRVALAPAPAPSSGLARLTSALARLGAGRRRAARGLADFIVTTVARSRAQQATIAMNAAIGVVMVVLELTRRSSDFAGFAHESAALSRVPLILAYWLAVGLRAAFFVPSELPAAWTFRANAPEGLRSRHRAIRGASAALLVPPLIALTSILSALTSGRYEAIQRTAFATLAGLLLVESIALTTPFMPFVRAYEPGHAKLKTRWLLYAIGVYLFGYVLERIERACAADVASFAALLFVLAATIVALDVAGEWRTRRAPIDLPEQVFTDDGQIVVLDIGMAAHRAQAAS